MSLGGTDARLVKKEGPVGKLPSLSLHAMDAARTSRSRRDKGMEVIKFG